MGILSNSKHELFAQELAKGATASAAFVTAGYRAHEGNASRLSGNEKVRARVEELLAVGAEQAGLTIKFVIDGLMENYRRSMQAEEIKDNKGGGTGEYRYEGAVANRSLELLGKQLGMFKDKVEHSGSVQISQIKRIVIDPA